MFVHANSWLPVVAIALYGVMIVALPKITAKKPVKVGREGGREGGVGRPSFGQALTLKSPQINNQTKRTVHAVVLGHAHILTFPPSLPPSPPYSVTPPSPTGTSFWPSFR